jgi:hypothetical protein
MAGTRMLLRYERHDQKTARRCLYSVYETPVFLESLGEYHK